VGVLSHQRDDTKRKANKNGYKSRSFNNRVGQLLLAKPQIREFAFQTQLFENYQRSEKALLSAICQMVTDGVSTNQVKKIVSKLSPDLIFSKYTVSRITQELDPQIKHWREGLTERSLYLLLHRCRLFLLTGKPSGGFPAPSCYRRCR
jgi:transposase-like protein